ncbi:ABC transporter ATP-binding protein [Variovorax boronicumulans]|uniref:ABC transporter ATP-binding protein n=1 Tax=Variovorax boronicumulans TaxID=436515 RepID=UPI00214BE6B9
MNMKLQVAGIDTGYGRIPVLHGVSMCVAPHEAVAIIGANGAGKSTLVRAVCGLLPLGAGSITKDGREIGAMPAHQRVQQGLGVVLENRNLFGELSVLTNLQAAQHQGARRQVARRFSLDDVIELFPFMHGRLDSAVELLSGGEQQMVAIARALLLQPDLLVMDEPSTGLAPKVLRHIVEATAKLRERGLAILLIEQNVALAAEIADRAYVMSLGRVVQEIQPHEWGRIMENEDLMRAYLGA